MARRASATRSFSLQLTSSLPYLVVFTPPARDYFCVEPVSHVSNAIHMADPAAHGLVALAAGDTLEALDDDRGGAGVIVEALVRRVAAEPARRIAALASG